MEENGILIVENKHQLMTHQDYQKLPYDIFNDIIDNVTIQTLWQLYQTNKTIQKLCNSPFCQVLVKFSSNQFFNLEAKSELLDHFLNDITLGDKTMLRRLQLVLGSCLTGNRSFNQIIILQGICNGKSTLLSMLSRLLGLLYTKGVYLYNGEKLVYDECSYVVNYPNIMNLQMLHSLESSFIKEGKLACNIIIDSCAILSNTPLNDLDVSVTEFLRRIVEIGLPCHFVNNPTKINERKLNSTLKENICNDNTISAFLNFLLEGCKAVLEK